MIKRVWYKGARSDLVLGCSQPYTEELLFAVWCCQCREGQLTKLLRIRD